MNILKIEAFAGMSGDMFLGALAALADAYDELAELPSRLGLEAEAEIRITEVDKKGIACRHVQVVDKQEAHRHDHEHGHGHEHPHAAHHHHHHRHLKDIYAIIDRGKLTEGAKGIAREIFRLLGEAESQVHGVPVEKIHFHEVGAIDSIIDIVGTAWLLDRLNIEQSYSTPVTTGFGFAMTEHGRLPIPCPATQRLLLGFPTERGDQRGELTTPTGAAIFKYLDPSFELPALIEEKVGYGPGEKELEIPNALRLSLCRSTRSADTVTVIETNLDDIQGEWLGTDFQERLFENGALDFFLQQVIMKKGRPGVVLTVLCREPQREALCRFLLQSTSTIGLRYYTARRWELPRRQQQLDLPFGRIRVKEVVLPDGSRRIKPESADLLRLAQETGYALQELQKTVLDYYWKEKK